MRADRKTDHTIGYIGRSSGRMVAPLHFTLPVSVSSVFLLLPFHSFFSFPVTFLVCAIFFLFLSFIPSSFPCLYILFLFVSICTSFFFPSFPTDFHITCIRPSYNRGHVYLALLPWKCKRLGTWDHHPVGTTVCASLLAAFETFARVSRNLIRTNVKATPTLYCLRNFLQSITAMHKLESHDRH